MPKFLVSRWLPVSENAGWLMGKSEVPISANRLFFCAAEIKGRQNSSVAISRYLIRVVYGVVYEDKNYLLAVYIDIITIRECFGAINNNILEIALTLM